MLEDELLKTVIEIKSWEGSKGRRKKHKRLRQELLDLFPKDKIHLVVGEFILEKQYNPVTNKESIAIYTKDSWNKREEYFNNKKELSLKWI